MAQLSIRGLAKSFGRLSIIEGFHLNIEQGARHAIIGPNGAGKTTLFNMISGWLRPTAGGIFVEGRNIVGLRPDQVAKAGLARCVPEEYTFRETNRPGKPAFGSAVAEPRSLKVMCSKSRFGGLEERACDAAVRMNLQDVLHRQVRALSYGQKRQLEVGIALACSPRILLLDEPAAGTSPGERLLLMELLRALPADITLLLVEHDMDVVFGICSQITVLNYGRVVATGTPEEIRRDPDVRAAYLGPSTAAMA